MRNGSVDAPRLSSLHAIVTHPCRRTCSSAKTRGSSRPYFEHRPFQRRGLSFEWDEAKAVANRWKHGVSFEEAATVFLDPLARLFDAPETAHGEMRLLLVGVSLARRTLNCGSRRTRRGASHRQRSTARRRERAVLEERVTACARNTISAALVVPTRT